LRVNGVICAHMPADGAYLSDAEVASIRGDLRIESGRRPHRCLLASAHLCAFGRHEARWVSAELADRYSWATIRLLLLLTSAKRVTPLLPGQLAWRRRPGSATGPPLFHPGPLGVPDCAAAVGDAQRLCSRERAAPVAAAHRNTL
jgi:hypothetical protein